MAVAAIMPDLLDIVVFLEAETGYGEMAPYEIAAVWGRPACCVPRCFGRMGISRPARKL
jgi:hypothetical protein